MLGAMGAPRIPRRFWIYLASRFCAATSMTLLRAAVAWHVFAITAEKRDAALDAAIGCPGVAQMSCPL